MRGRVPLQAPAAIPQATGGPGRPRGGRVVTVALDAMGGDAGVASTVEGAALLSREEVPVQVLLVGDPIAVEQQLRQVRYDPQRLQVVASSGVVRGGDPPRATLDRLPDCSIAVAARLVRDGDADALVSAGDTGAVILASSDAFRRLEGVRRAALAAVFPTEQRHGPREDPFALMLDVGATVQATAEDLLGFAAMGSAYSAIISELPAPRIALLSNGSEPSKGTPAIVEAHARLAKGPLAFAGNVEGVELLRGTVDVIVCDGFLGNVVLKMIEGMSEIARDLARGAAESSLQARIGLSMLGPELRQLRARTDWKRYGGAPLLGFDRVVIKAHGRSEARAIRNAIKVAAKAAEGDLAGRIRDTVLAMGGAA